jgi:mRNA interferase RelE/StbE
MKALLDPTVVKRLKRIHEPTKSRLILALKKLEQEPPVGDIKRMGGKAGYFRLRVGGYRVLFRIGEREIFVTDIEPRGDVYKKGGRKK